MLLAIIASSLFAASYGQEDEIEDIEVVEEEKAFLLVRKTIVNREKIVVGKLATVEIQIHNAGTRCSQHAGPLFQYAAAHIWDWNINFLLYNLKALAWSNKELFGLLRNPRVKHASIDQVVYQPHESANLSKEIPDVVPR